MSTLTTTRIATLPRVNLLPPELADLQRFRRVQVALGGGVVAALAVAAGLALLATGAVNSAQSDLDATKADGVRLQAQVDEYAEVPRVFAQVEAAEAQLTQAMGKEIRWSYFMNDLSLRVPSRVWLTEMTVTQNVDDATAGSTAGATARTPAYIQPEMGLVTFRGVASRHNDVAAWLNSLGRLKAYKNPYFTDSTENTIGEEKVVEFDSQLTITEKALSKRYTDKAGS